MEQDEKKLSLLSCSSKIPNIVEIFKLLLEKSKPDQTIKSDDGNEPVFVSPSEYITQMTMTTEQRTDFLIKHGQKFDINSSLNNRNVYSLQAIPSIVIFQQFDSSDTYTVCLLIQNISKISKHVKMNCKPDPSFQIEFKGNTLNTRLAPGMTLTYEVKFCPEEKRDYVYEATFVSDNEIFTVPVIAIGPRAILDFPDRIEIPSTAVKIASSKTVLVRNIGNVPAIFSLYSQDPRFNITPAQGVIDEEEMIQFTVNFISNRTGDFEAKLFLKYESGEIVRLDLQGSAVNCNIRLERGSLRMEDTYFSMSRSKPLAVHNRSDHIVRFRWTQYKDREEDEKRRERYKELFNDVKSVEMIRCADLVHYDICQQETHSLICQRIYADEVASLTNETFPYQNSNFFLDPMEGEIWPQNSINIVVYFQPSEIGEITSIAYLEISGREDRLPLSLNGTCIGPNLHLSAVTINTGNIFMCSSHNYELTCSNKGLIPGTFVHKPKISDFGGTLQITPSKLNLEPEEFKSFIITFCSKHKGQFVERIDFMIKESLEIIPAYIKGCVVCPLLCFDKDCLNFGKSAIGFTYEQDVCLNNHSSVPVKFKLSVPDDGNETAVTYKDIAGAQTKPSFPPFPKEFIISPFEGVVCAKDSLKAKVSYTPNILRSGKTLLRLEMWDSESEAVFLPIVFSVETAKLEVKPTEVVIGFCFINVSYTQMISIQNKSDIEGYFCMVPQSTSLTNSIEYVMSPNEGSLKPKQSKKITMTVVNKTLGKQETSILMLTLGENDAIICCNLVCNGQGPVVSVDPTNLDWKNLNLLDRNSLQLTMVNDSPIPAEFTVSLSKKNSPWSVQPISGELRSNQSRKLQVTAFLRNAGKYSDRLLIKVTNGNTIPITLNATGVGTSIVSNPAIFPTFEMGLLFSCQDIKLPIVLKNEGTRHHQLLFANKSDVRSLLKGPIQIQEYDKYQIEPNMIELLPGASATVFCKIHWKKNETVSEEWYLHGVIQGEGKREILASSLFRATFIETNISFSKTELRFRVDVDINGEKLQEIDELYVINESGLDLNTHLTVNPPFYLINETENDSTRKLTNKLKIVLAKKAQTPIRVQFAFNRDEDPNSRLIEEILLIEYDENPNKDKIKCQAEVNFPTIIPMPRELHFSCELGSSVSRKIILLNEMPISVFYRLEWLQESISINRLDLKPQNSLSILSDSEESNIHESPSKLLIPALHSPLLNDQNDKPETLEPKDIINEDNESSILMEEVKEFCFAMIDQSFLEEDNISILKCLCENPSEMNFVNQLIEISPHEGMLLPYSSQYTNLVFHGIEPIQIEAKLICEIKLGTPEIIKIKAVADKLRFCVSTNCIDIGQQKFCEVCEAYFHLENHCMMPFEFHTKTSENSKKILKIEPEIGQVEPMSNLKVQVIYEPSTVGPFEEEIQLFIEHYPPISVKVEGFAVIPQVYINIPKTRNFKDYPIEFGYYAIQLIDDNYLKITCDENKYEDTLDSTANYENLTDNCWEIIDKEDPMPNACDIDMAFERFLAKQFVAENPYVLEKHRSEQKKGVIPFLLSPAYIIDLGYVIVQNHVRYSATLINYGPEKAEVRLKKPENKSDLIKSGIFIEFNDNKNLLVGKSTDLQIICHPKQERYKKSFTNIEHTIYIEVAHGFTIPVIIKAIITYPFLTVNTKHLDFSNVIIGECHQMRLLLKNEGYVACQWEANLISNCKKREDGPFYLHYTSDIFSPGCSGIIDIFFKPKKPCNMEEKLLIKVLEGQENILINLTGKGVERRLKISKSIIKFKPLIPNTVADEATIVIENPGPYPVEFYWRHLENSFLHEDRVGRVLTHYYGVQEILLPQREIGEEMPKQLINFYTFLVKEMAADLGKQFTEDLQISTVDENTIFASVQEKVSVETSVSQETKKRKKGKRKKLAKGGKSQPESLTSEISKKEKLTAFSDLEFLTTDPREIESLLHSYINKLQKDPDFPEKMFDPVKEVFDSLEPKSSIIDSPIETSRKKKIFIIFHGAPFTEYQEAACKSTSIIGVPGLVLNTVFLEIISSGTDEISTKLRKTIDVHYEENMTKIKSLKQVLVSIEEEKISPDNTPRSQQSDTKRSLKGTARTQSKNVTLDPRILSELEKLPSGNDFHSLDIYSIYECKVESILLIDKMLSSVGSASPIKEKSSTRGSNKKKFDDTFLGFDHDSLKSVLKLRLSMPDFTNGFVLQTLDNHFIKNNITIFLILLEIVENVDFYMFVTFYNTFSAYKERIDGFHKEKEEKAATEMREKLEKLENMTQEEIDLLNDEDRGLYKTVILSRKKQDSIVRRKIYQDHVMKLRHHKTLNSMNNRETTKTNGISRKTKSAKLHITDEKLDLKITSPKKISIKSNIKDGAVTKISDMSTEFKNISEAMNQYFLNLESLLEIIQDWDPKRKEDSIKRAHKGKTQPVINKENSTSEWFIWHVKASNPWDAKIYDSVISQMSENNFIPFDSETGNTFTEPDLQPRIYSVLIPKKLQPINQTETGIESCSPCPYLEQHPPKKVSTTTLSVQEGSMKSTSAHQFRQNISQSGEKLNQPENSAGLVQSTISLRSASNESNHSITLSVIEESLKPTTILQPYESQSYKVRFFPDKIGQYKEQFSLTIANSLDKTYDIKVDGVSDIPKINMDPSVIFTKIEETKIDGINDPSYFLDSSTFDFGSLLINNNRKDKSKPHRRTALLKFINISLIPAQVTFSLKGDNSSAFSIQSDELIYVKPEETGTIELSAVATKLGTNSARLIVNIMENPETFTIELRCNGTKMDVALEEKTVNFNKILLNREDKRSVRILNKCSISGYWRLKASEKLNSQISFSPSNGWIQPKETMIIDFVFKASKVGMLEKSDVNFEVFLNSDDHEALFREVITVTGEAYDVSVDVNNASPIDLKNIKVDSVANEKFTIKNLGLYPIKYSIEKESDASLKKIDPYLEKNKAGNFEIRPSSDTVLPDKTAVINVSFKPTREIILKKAPILKCCFFDAFTKNEIIAEFQLTVSIISYYTRFRLHPFPELNFGAIAIYSQKIMYLNVENIGNFPLHFTVSLSAQKLTLPSERGKKKSPIVEKLKAVNESSLKAGCFLITKIDGVIEAGQLETVEIICSPENKGEQFEEINIFVADCAPDDKNGKKLKLVANCCVPSIDFHDLDVIFHENNVVDSFQDFKCPQELGAHTVFARHEKCLYFCRIPVSSAHTTCFKLCNRSEVQAEVTILLRRPEMPMTQQTSIDVFQVDPTKTCILPMSDSIFTISFSPKIIETYSAILEAEIELPSHLKTDRLSVRLLGEACVPEIILVEPTARTTQDHIILSFNRILMGETGVRKLAFQNIGFLEAKVILEIYDDPKFLFSLESFNSPKKKRNVHTFDSHGEESLNRYVVCSLPPDEIAHFRVKFQPYKVGKYNAFIRIAVVGNPFENITVNLEGDSYNEAVVLDRLEFVDNNAVKYNVSETARKSRKSALKSTNTQSTQSLKSSSARISTSFAILIYKLDFGSCFLNKMSKISFRIVNKTEDKIFRFQWSQHPNVIFTPSIGHLSPCKSKEIVATFLAVESISYFQVPLDCTIQEILYPELNNNLSWDDRQINANWDEMRNNLLDCEPSKHIVFKKVTEQMPEPFTEIVSGSSRYIQLLLSAIATYSKYQCKVQHIHFKDTLMFQKTNFKFFLTNPASVNLEYNWKLTIDEKYPIRLGETQLRPIFKQRSKHNIRSRPSSRSSNGILYPNEGTDNKPKCNISNIRDEKGKLVNPCSEQELGQPSDLFSSTACLTDRSTDSWIEGDSWPFEIQPENGIILPGQSVECNLTFSPSDVFEYTACLKCLIENHNPEQEALCIPIMARSLLPYCHFDIPDSDYLSSGRRNSKLPGPLAFDVEDQRVRENIRVIEFQVIGIGDCHTKEFNLINPTLDDYEFSWTDCTDYQLTEVHNFHCVTSKGSIPGGKRSIVSFTFYAENLGTFESFWSFKIDKYDLETLFLIVANVVEPEAYCVPIHLQMKPTILGWKVNDEIKIINKEDFELPFNIVKESLYSEGRFHNLMIKPISGILAPNSEQILSVEYNPTMEGEITFSVQCCIDKIKNPLNIFVNTKAYNLETQVFYKNSENDDVELCQHQENIVDLRKLELNRPKTVEFQILNVGKVDFFYTWNVQNLNTDSYTITVSEKEGRVDSESRITCHLSLTASERVKIKDHLLTLEINKGPIYYILLKATASKSSVSFSFSKFDFGPRYIQETISANYHIDLQIKNFDKTPSIIECTFEDLPHLIVDLDNISQAIDGNSSVNVRIHFRPLATIKYREILTFLINSTNEKNITISGEGIPYKVRLANPCEKCIDIGNIPVDKLSIRKVQILNEGLAPIELKFGFLKILEASKNMKPMKLDLENEQKEKTEGKNIEKTDSILATLSQALSIHPAGPVVLQPNKKLNMVLKFKPQMRIKQFFEKVGIQMDSTILPLTIVKGSCVGAEFLLNRTYISFGSVVQGCSLNSKLMLLNTGDVGARFKWNTSKLGPHFHIKPLSGYCSPGMDISFDVNFQPIHQANFLEGQGTIEIEKYRDLTITVCGGCSKLPDPLDTLNFAIQVRQKQIKQVSITNDTSETWILKPETNGDYFSTEDILKVSPKLTQVCSVTYFPLEMTLENSFQKGRLLVKLPGGKRPILYSLLGTSLPPEAIAKIVRQFPAKTKYAESLPVYNWLNRQQRFDCKIELIASKASTRKVESVIYTFTGNRTLDVPANGKRDYRAFFHCYKESNFHFKVTFKNPEGEYQYYELQYKVTKPEVTEVIKLKTTVRLPTYHFIQLKNPLDNDSIKYIANCSHQDITIHDNPKIIPALSSETIKIEYNPLLPSNAITQVEINCSELGVSFYELHLTAKPASQEEVIRVISTLGGFTIFPLIFTNFSKKNTEFTVKLENSSFTCEKSVVVQSQSKGTLDIKYEPCDIENVTATAIISSNIAGEYIFPIIGNYVRPKPQGPFPVSVAQPCSIPFNNIFLETKTFKYVIKGSTHFIVNVPSETIESKKTVNIIVHFNDQNEQDDLDNQQVTGKLIVKCTDPRISKINWIYYLNAVH